MIDFKARVIRSQTLYPTELRARKHLAAPSETGVGTSDGTRNRLLEDKLLNCQRFMLLRKVCITF